MVVRSYFPRDPGVDRYKSLVGYDWSQSGQDRKDSNPFGCLRTTKTLVAVVIEVRIDGRPAHLRKLFLIPQARPPGIPHTSSRELATGPVPAIGFSVTQRFKE